MTVLVRAWLLQESFFSAKMEPQETKKFYNFRIQEKN